MKAPKDWISMVGGAMAMSAVIFGLGLFLIGSSGSKAPATNKEEPKEEEKTAKEEGHGEKKADAHGEATKEDAHGEASEHGEPKKSKKDKKESAHGEGEGEGHGEGHGKEAKEPKEEKPRVPARKAREEMTDWIADGEKALTYGNFEQAVEKFNLAYKRAPSEQGLDDLKSISLLRLADATRKCDSIPLQRRNERALELYSKLLADFPSGVEAESGQFQVGFCLEELGKFSEAEQAFGQFATRFPFSSKVPDARVNQAANLLVQNEPLKAKKLLQNTLKLSMSDESKGRVMARIAQADLMLARQGLLPEEAQSAKAEAVQIKDPPIRQVSQPIPAPETAQSNERGTFGFSPAAFNAATNLKPNTQPEKAETLLTDEDQRLLTLARPKDIPEEMWLRVVRSLDTGNLGEARHLMRPYMDESGPNNTMNPQQYLTWARVLRGLAERKIATTESQPKTPAKAEGVKP